jgi:hypothetical protein
MVAMFLKKKPGGLASGFHSLCRAALGSGGAL